MLIPREMIDVGLWRLFPAIEVCRTEAIPCDYPGVMGVPGTAMRRIQGDDRFEILEVRHDLKIGGRTKYARVMIRLRHARMPDMVDINAMLREAGSNYRVEFEGADDIRNEEGLDDEDQPVRL